MVGWTEGACMLILDFFCYNGVRTGSRTRDERLVPVTLHGAEVSSGSAIGGLEVQEEGKPLQAILRDCEWMGLWLGVERLTDTVYRVWTEPDVVLYWAHHLRGCPEKWPPGPNAHSPATQTTPPGSPASSECHQSPSAASESHQLLRRATVD